MRLAVPLVAAPLVAALLALVAAVPARAVPIPEGPDAASLPAFLGTQATPHPVTSPDPPRHPFMARNGRSNLHVDAYQTDVQQFPGPLGNGTTRRSAFYGGVCASNTFDSAGRIVTVCVGATGPVLRLLDPVTLDTLASYVLPPRQPGAISFTDFAGGGYFYLDDHDRAVVPTTTRHLLTISETPGPGFAVERDVDVSVRLAPDDKIISALPDWSGRLWFATTRGIMGTVDRRTAAVRTLDLREPIGNSFAVEETGAVYVVTTKALYRLAARADGTPRVQWREPYANTGVLKPGQASPGSGTTPTLMGRDLVTITDNADPMNVLVLRRGLGVTGPRLLCRQPVFDRGASATDQSLIATNESIVAENNYGYSGPTATQGGKSTAPGLERIDVDRASGRCRSVWRSQERAPSVVPKLSAANGLVYTYTKDPQPGGADAWYLTALDFRTGATVFKALAGEGLGHNNNYAPITVSPDGAIFVGVLGGIVALRDRVPPPGAAPAGGTNPRQARRVQLRLIVHRAGRRGLRVRVVGRDAGRVRRVRFSLSSTRLRHTDRRAPFTVRITAARRPHGSHVRRLRARILLRGGRTVVRTRRITRAPRPH
jgi:hypothetical protein